MIVVYNWSGIVNLLCVVRLLCVVSLLAACGSSPSSSPTTGSGRRLEVLAAVYPYQFLAERIAGGHAQVTNLTQPGAEPHDLELTPKQVGSIAEADLVVYEHGFQPAVDDAVREAGAEHILDTTSVVPLRDLGTADQEGAPAGRSQLDPHVWLDPTQLATIATAIAQALTRADPDHGPEFAANADRLKSELTRLDRRFRTGLTACSRTHFLTQHAAFGYLARRYGLTQISISGLSPETEPSAARIAQVQREAKRYRVTTIFYETLVSPAVATSIAGDLGLKTDVLDPLEGITEHSRGRDYLAVMDSNLTSLRAAGGCR